MEPFARVPKRYDNEFADSGAIERAVGKRRRSRRTANLGTFTGYRIGFDIGNGNIGWCVLFEDGLQPRFLTAEDIVAHNAALPRNKVRTQLPNLGDFVPLGTHKFQAREPGEKTEKSFSKVRAEARGKRKLLDARQRRKLHLRQALEKAGLLPAVSQEPGGHPKIHADILRHKLLDPAFPAHPHDLGRALMNALKRRGYMKPVGRAGKDEASDFGDKATQTYRAALKRYDCKTVGQFLEICAQHAKQDGEKFRKRHSSLDWQNKNKKFRPKEGDNPRSYETFRFLTPTLELSREEARLLRDCQRKNVMVSDEQWADIEEKAEFRRNLKAKMPGRCRHFPEEFRCVRALPSFQRFRNLEQVNHLRDIQGRALDETQFECAMKLLETAEKASLAELARTLGSTRLNFDKGDDEGRRTLAGAKSDIALTAAYGEAWMRLPIDARDAWVMRFLRRHETRKRGSDGQPETPPWTKNDDAELERDAKTAFGPDALATFDGEAAKSVRAEDKFASISTKAARLLSECYQKRLDHEARMRTLIAAGTPESELKLFERLPYYGAIMPDLTVPAIGFAPAERTCAEELAHGRAPNPDVHVVLNRVRAVVNEIVEMMGGILPSRCIVEVARSALSEEQADAHSKRARDREKLRSLIEADIDKVYNGPDQRRPVGPALDRLVERWKAAIRQGWRDYDGSRIERSVLVDSTIYQLDHISPAAFGDVRENNLFVTRFNQQKGRKLPWAAFKTESSFRPALLAFATFGYQQRIAGLKAALNPKPPRKGPFGERKRRLEDSLARAEAQFKSLTGYETPQPDVLSALRHTLTGKLDDGMEESDDGGKDTPARGVPKAFRPGDQAALFCRFHPEARPPEKEFAARDVANIGWSTKLALRYLGHLGAETAQNAIKPWAVYALRCMLGINKWRADLRNHAVDAFLIAHFDSRVLRQAFDHLKNARPEDVYSTRHLGWALDQVDGGQGFLDELQRGIERLERILPAIATAHRADNRWNPGDKDGGSFGSLGGENIYAFHPTEAERKKLTAIAAKYGKAPADGRVMTRKELHAMLLAEPADDEGCKLWDKLHEAAKVRYHSVEGEKATEKSVKSALPIRSQPRAFIDAKSKFAIAAPTAAFKRRIVSVAEFSQTSATNRTALFAMGQPIYRRGDTVIDRGMAYVVASIMGDGRLGLYPIDSALKEQSPPHRPTVPISNTQPIFVKFSSDVLGRRLHRLRKNPRGLKPVPYPLRGQ
jgi:hypothetical protein